MATVNIDYSKFKGDLNKIKEQLSDKEALLRPMAIELSGIMNDRIHEQGLASDGNPIGTYSEGYMKVRTGDFKNSEKFVRGKNKGKLKGAGFKTKQRIATPFGKSAFTTQNIEADKVPRIRYNLDSSKKVILVLTRKLSNSWAVFATDRGYAIGFTDSGATEGVTSLKKIEYAEETYKKRIQDLTKEETQYYIERLNELSTEIIGRS